MLLEYKNDGRLREAVVCNGQGRRNPRLQMVSNHCGRSSTAQHRLDSEGEVGCIPGGCWCPRPIPSPSECTKGAAGGVPVWISQAGHEAQGGATGGCRGEPGNVQFAFPPMVEYGVGEPRGH